MPSKEVEEALRELTQMLSLEESLTQVVRDKNKYGECFVPIIQIEDPNGLLDGDPETHSPSPLR